ncbi:MAG: hypothetical protein WD885_00430 [Candidatus Saccharimonadales bacterium]
MSDKLPEIAAEKALELKDLRDVSLRRVVEAYLEGNPDLFDVAAGFFDEGTPVMKDLLKIRDRVHPDPVKSIGYLVGSVHSIRFQMGNEGLLPPDQDEQI